MSSSLTHSNRHVTSRWSEWQFDDRGFPYRWRINRDGLKIYDYSYPNQPSTDQNPASQDAAPPEILSSVADNSIPGDGDYYESRNYKFRSEDESSASTNNLVEGVSNLSVRNAGQFIPSSLRPDNTREDASFGQPGAHSTTSRQGSSLTNYTLTGPGRQMGVPTTGPDRGDNQATLRTTQYESSAPRTTQTTPSYYDSNQGTFLAVLPSPATYSNNPRMGTSQTTSATYAATRSLPESYVTYPATNASQATYASYTTSAIPQIPSGNARPPSCDDSQAARQSTQDSHSQNREYQPSYPLPPAAGQSDADERRDGELTPAQSYADRQRPASPRGRDNDSVSQGIPVDAQPRRDPSQSSPSRRETTYNTIPSYNDPHYSESRLGGVTSENTRPSRRQRHSDHRRRSGERTKAGRHTKGQSRLHEDRENSDNDEEDSDNPKKNARQQIIDRPKPKPGPGPTNCREGLGCGMGPQQSGGAVPRPPPGGASRSGNTKDRKRDTQSSRTDKGKSSSGRKRNAGVDEEEFDVGEPDIAESEAKEFARWLAEYDTWKDVTCACGFGYYTIEGEWIPGVEVRAGKAPPKPAIPPLSISLLKDEFTAGISAC